jgi:lysyl-tRNA synthetase class 2
MNASPAAEHESWRPTAELQHLRERARLLARARDYFARTDALEVETPALVRAPVTDVHLESMRVVDDAMGGATVGYLQTSPEYAMKRLLSAGAPDIYQVCRVFRAGERGGRHNPEFTMIEWYRRDVDQHGLMRDVEALIATALEGSKSALLPSECITYREAFEHVMNVDPLHASGVDLVRAIERVGVPLPESMRASPDRDDLLDLAMGTLVAASFPVDRVTFVHDFPASQAALARIDGDVAARFEAFVGSLELANGFHELGDASEQRARFAADLERRRALGRPQREADELFLAALRHGLPPCSGVALGFDRLCMVAMEAQRIDDVVAFPFERA